MKILRNALIQMGQKVDEDIIVKFIKYRELVLRWNEKVNLTAIRDPEEFETRHFVDSVSCCGFSGFQEAGTVIDVGTGAGFPGMPLAILFPEKEFVLLDSLNKRIRILNEIAEELGLKNVTAIHGRAEDIARKEEHREHYDLCLSRAVADLAVLSEYCLPFVKVGGWFGAYKTKKAEAEIERSQKAISVLGGRMIQSEEGFPSEAGVDHRIVWIKKERPVGSKYPRKAGTPEKEPLC